MKKIFLLFFIISLFTSCVVYENYSVKTELTDFSKYSKAGFYITESNSVSFDYKPIGSIMVIVTGGKLELPSQNEMYYGEVIDVKPTMIAALDEMVKKGTQKGANGLINLKYEYVIPSVDADKINFGKIIITGMLIEK